MTADVDPLIPDYEGACIANVVPAILGRVAESVPRWMPAAVAAADQVVLLAIDGIGWQQLDERATLAPTLMAMTGGPITSVVPSTTSTALTSLTTGTPPARHGVLGYRVRVGDDDGVMNVLRWRTAEGDARAAVPPAEFQTIEPFGGSHPPVVTRAEFAGGGFSGAHLAGVRHYGWRMPSTLVSQVRRLLDAGEPFIYAYYDGVDKVAHEFGLGDHYDAEVAATDRLVSDVIDVLPTGAVLVVTSDHGQIDVADNVVPLHHEIMGHTRLLSGEGRFRWLHAHPGMVDALADVAREHYGDRAWVRTRTEAEGEGWFGGTLATEFSDRVGDVLLAAIDPIAFLDPHDTGDIVLVSRHGSLTPAEMLVPLLVAGP